MAIRDLRNSDVSGYPGIKWIFIDVLYTSGYFRILNILCLLWGLPAGCVCDALPAALQNPQKKHALDFWSMYLMGFIDCCWFLNDVDIFLLVLGSPSRVRVCCAACGASEPSEKTRPWNFGACTLCVLLNFLAFQSILMYFCRFWGLPAGCVCVALPAALQNPQKKHVPGILEHVPYGFYSFSVIFLKKSFPPTPAPRQIQTCQV